MGLSIQRHMDLRRKYNPDGSDLRRLQLRQLKMLEYLDNICQREGIRYWLAAGNLLGYVRHYGEFIPWDDDIDIELEQNEYRRLIKVLKKEKHPEFCIQDGHNDRYFENHFAKLRDRGSIVDEQGTDLYAMRGCYIDIFPMGRNLPSVLSFTTNLRWRLFDFIERKVKILWLRKSLTLISKYSLQRLLFPAIAFIVRPFTAKDRIYHIPASVGSDFKPRRISNLFPLQRIVFEGVEVSAPANPEGFLTDMYGRYDDVPDESNLHFHFDRDKIKWL